LKTRSILTRSPEHESGLRRLMADAAGAPYTAPPRGPRPARLAGPGPAPERVTSSWRPAFGVW